MLPQQGVNGLFTPSNPLTLIYEEVAERFLPVLPPRDTIPSMDERRLTAWLITEQVLTSDQVKEALNFQITLPPRRRSPLPSSLYASDHIFGFRIGSGKTLRIRR